MRFRYLLISLLLGCSSTTPAPESLRVSEFQISPPDSSREFDDHLEVWSRLTATFDLPHLESPLHIDDNYFGIADVRDVVPNIDAQGDVLLLLKFDKGSYVPLDRYGGSVCIQERCEFISPAIEGIDSPIFRVGFLRKCEDCRPIIRREDYFLTIVSEEIVSLLPADFSNNFWGGVEISAFVDRGVIVSECSNHDWFANDMGSSESWCLEYLESEYRFDHGKPVLVNESRIANPRPIEACLFWSGERCAGSVTIYPDPDCPNPRQMNLYAYQVFPCTYGYWVLTAETELRELGYPVTVDGYFRSTEIEFVKRAQADYGLAPDGLIGEQSWKRLFSSLDCRGFDPRTGTPTTLEFCYRDLNNDGFYGPGDLIPD